MENMRAMVRDLGTNQMRASTQGYVLLLARKKSIMSGRCSFARNSVDSSDDLHERREDDAVSRSMD